MTDTKNIHEERAYSMDIRSSKAYPQMLSYLWNEIRGFPNYFEDGFLEELKQEPDYEEILFGVPFFSNVRAQNILKSCKPKNMEELENTLVLIDHPELADYVLCCLKATNSHKPWDIGTIPLCPEDFWKIPLSYKRLEAYEDMDKIVKSMFRMDDIYNDIFAGREILDNSFSEIPQDYVFMAERIFKCSGYRRFQTRKELAARTKDLVSLALAKEYEPDVYLKAYMKYYAGEKAGNIKTREDFDLFEAQITATGTANMSDYYDYLLLKKLHAYIDWKYDYSSDIVYKEQPLWEIKYI